MRKRDPYKLVARDVTSQVPCLLANIRYMAGEGDRPDVDYVDRKLNRQPGEPYKLGSETNFLLGEGYQVHIITPWSDERFLKEGMEYLREFYQPWTPELQAYFTPERVETLKADKRRYRRYQAPFKRRQKLTTENRPPTLDDIVQAVANKYVVDVTLGKKGETTSVAALVWDMYLPYRHPHVYDPSRPDELAVLVNLGVDLFMEQWLPKAGIRICRF